MGARLGVVWEQGGYTTLPPMGEVNFRHGLFGRLIVCFSFISMFSFLVLCFD